MAFTDKVVWITGASSGIGEALAILPAGSGAKRVLTARRTALRERLGPDVHILVEAKAIP